MSVENHPVVIVEGNHLVAAFEMLTKHVDNRLKKHGSKAFTSRHEGFGMLMEEIHEVAAAIRNNTSNDFADEIQDVATVCVWTLASMIATTNAQMAADKTVAQPASAKA